MISKLKFGFAAIMFSTGLAAPSAAGDLTDVFSKCVAKHVQTTSGATVTLECNAADGKVNDCKVINGPIPRAGFDKAALCVADALPVGSKTGTITFPIKFEHGHY